jgi:periplasmic divalent cation tolerance protein
MRTGAKYRIVLVTCGSLTEARKIGRALVEKRLAACVNIFMGPVESHYRWKDRLEMAREHLLLIKTTLGRLAQLEREVRRLHSYDVPEFLVLPVAYGSAAYLAWLFENVKPSK